ncbi:MAG: hypothetical protein RL026_1554 [Pseudomonadota bacterium]
MFLQLLMRNADYRPDEVAILHGDRQITHRGLLDQVEGLARGLVGLGLEPGQRVALVMDNSAEFLAAWFAVAACRGVNVPLNTDFKEEELAFYLRDADVRCLVVDESRAALAARLRDSLPQPLQIVVNGTASPASGTHSLQALSGTPPGVVLPASRLDDDVIYIYTSGSTGRPKCAPRTVEQYWFETDDVVEGLRLTRADRIFCMIPMYHNFGAVHCMLASVASGARLVILGKAQPFSLHRRRALALMQQERVTILPGVPFMYAELASVTEAADIRSVRVCYSAAAALTDDIADAFRSRFGVPIRNHYGSTETGVMTINMDADPLQARGSVGKPFPGVRIRILDEDGTEMPRGEEGEVVVSSRAMTRGYLGLPPEENQHFRGGAFHTGDLGLLDAEGNLHLRGRRRFIIDVVGQKVSPVEIEDVMAQHPAVQGVTVIGVPSADGKSNVIRAYVHRAAACTTAELTAFCRERLANFKVPTEILFLREMPRSNLGKTIRSRDTLDALVIQG